MPTAQDNLTKATLVILEPKKGGNQAELDRIEFSFNPKEWSITRAAEWRSETTKRSTPPPEFKGPRPASISVEMFLDETEDSNGDISKTVARLFRCVQPEDASVAANKPSAPHVLFQWGDITFKGYIEQVAVKYTLFRGTGTPVRGLATLTIKEFPSAPGAQNPTSGGEPGNRSHRIGAGDTLASIAYREYGQAAMWRKIADFNPALDDPLRIPDGTVLLIPPA
jgi:hypothetical protein